MTHSFPSFSRLGLRALSLLMLLMSSSLLAQNGAVTVTQSFSYTGQIVTWTVPTGVTSLTIEARGAEGGLGRSGSVPSPGRGAVISGTVGVTASQSIKLLVGQQPAQGRSSDGGGGGGSFVTTSDNQPLFIAGGGGGQSFSSFYDIDTKQGRVTNAGGAGGGLGVGVDRLAMAGRSALGAGGAGA